MGVIQEAIRRSKTERDVYELSKRLRERRAHYQSNPELPKRVIPVKELEEMLGTEVAMQLAFRYAGRRFPSPWHFLHRLRARGVRADYQRGLSIRHLAQKYEMTQSRIRAMIADLQPERLLPKDPRDVDRLA